MTIYRKGTVRFIWLFVLVTFMLLLPSQMLAQTLITSHTGLQDTDGNYVYMNQGVSAEFCTPPGAVLRTPVTGGSDQLLYEECGFAPYYVRVDGAQAYILDWQDDEILRLPIAGGTPVKIADTDGAVFVRGFDTDADFVYWADEIGIRQTYKTGIGTMTLATPSPDDSFRSLTVDDTYVYYLVGWFDDYELRRVPKAGGAAQVLHADSAHCWTVHSLMVDDDTLYWAEGLCDAPNVIKYMPKDGSATPAVLYAGNPTREVTGLELVANLLLFTESQHPSSVSETSGKVRYMNKSGGAISDLVTNLTLPRGLISDGRYAFWSDRNDWVGGVGGTKQNPLPPVDMDGDGFDQTIDCDDNNPAVTVGNTCVSESSVTIEDGSGDASVTFPEITAGGTTTVTVGSCTPGSVEGITLVPTAPICVDINTDATFTPPAMVCIHYDDTGMTLIEEANLRMVHCDDIGNCDLLTCSPPEPVDTVNNVVCGCADSFSTFALGTPLDSDNDLVFDLLDNCPLTPNTFQEDKDEDGIGDACDFFDFEIFLPLLLGFGS